MFKAIDAWRLDLKWELASNVKANDETNLIRIDNRITGLAVLGIFVGVIGGIIPVSYTHLTLQTNREV